MDIPYGYCEAWPEELKALYHEYYRVLLRVDNLENYVKHVDPAGFESAMDQLDAAMAELRTVGDRFFIERYKYNMKTFVPMCKGYGG